jgi:hypothetical protein
MRWLDEGRFPTYFTNTATKDSLFDALALQISKHFNTTDISKPTQIEFRNINMFGKPKMNDPEPSTNANDLQIAFFSFLSRANAGMDVFWTMKVVVNKNDNNFYKREIKHQLDGTGISGAWFSEQQFISLFDKLIGELFENSQPLPDIISLGPPVDSSNLFVLNAEKWKVQKNTPLFGIAQPVFGPYQTVELTKYDSTYVKTKTKVEGDASMEFSNGKMHFNLEKTWDINKSASYKLILANDPDSSLTMFTVSTFSRIIRQSALGFIISGSSEGTGKDLSYNRNITGTIGNSKDTLKWQFALTHFVNGKIETGYLKNDNDSLSINSPDVNNEIFIKNESGKKLANINFGVFGMDVSIKKDLPAPLKKAIASLFAVLVSTKSMGE